MTTPARQTKAERREEARATAQRLREEAERRTRRNRLLAVVALAGGLAVLVALVVVILAQGDDRDGAAPSLAEVTAPQGTTEAGGIPVAADGIAGTTAGVAEDAVRVQVYSDFLCIWCAAFEEASAETLEDLRASGDVVVEYHLVAILDDGPAGYSTRAAAATSLVADRSPAAFLPFMDVLFVNRPAEAAQAPDDAQLAELARGAGVDEETVAAIADGSYLGEGSFEPFVRAVTGQAAADLPRLATPTILLDGEPLDESYDWREPGRLAEAIEDARG